MYLNRDIDYVSFRVAGSVRRTAFLISSVTILSRILEDKVGELKGNSNGARKTCKVI